MSELALLFAHLVSMLLMVGIMQNDWITGQVIGLDGGLSRVQPRRRQSN